MILEHNEKVIVEANGNCNYLIMDCCGGGVVLDIVESRTPGVLKFKGKFQEAEAVNKNKRIYPRDVLAENVKQLQEPMESRGLLGELDHPADSIIHFEKASHVITRLWWEGNVLMGEGEVLPTPAGDILKALIESNVRVGVSSRGVGNGKTNENGIFVIGENYKLITFDVVADPSTHKAFQTKVAGSKNESTAVSVENTAKTNKSGIDKPVKSEAVIALFGGLLKERANSIKARI